MFPTRCRTLETVKYTPKLNVQSSRIIHDLQINGSKSSKCNVIFSLHTNNGLYYFHKLLRYHKLIEKYFKFWKFPFFVILLHKLNCKPFLEVNRKNLFFALIMRSSDNIFFTKQKQKFFHSMSKHLKPNRIRQTVWCQESRHVRSGSVS